MSWFRVEGVAATRLDFQSWEGDVRTFAQGVLTTGGAGHNRFVAADGTVLQLAPMAPLDRLDDAGTVGEHLVRVCLSAWG